MPPSRPTLRRREALAFYLCISPWLLGFVFFVAGPMIASLYISTLRWDLLTPGRFIGLANYREMLTEDPLFWKSLRITTTYTLAYVPLDLLGGLAAALLLNARLRGIGVFRTIFYLPSVLAGVGYVVLWMWLFNPQAGLINTALFYLGIQGPRWLQDPHWALPALIMMSLWGIGRSMVIFLAGLQDIPSHLYEAAHMDGANAWRSFWAITLPLLTPAILFNLILGIINTFQTFTNAFIATNGGPLDSTLFYVLYLYRKAFQFFDMGYASALAWVLFVIVLACTLLVFKTSGRWVFYRGEVE
jgi:multiple sugar transport system permease protein